MEMYKEDIVGEEITLELDHIQEAIPEKGWVPAYCFWICDNEGNRMGSCDLRIGHTEGLYYGGNIGYNLKEEYRGHHYAVKACKLLFELARKHDLGYVIITCNPDNTPSRKTCEYLGGELLEVAELPEDHDLREDEDTHECIYKFEL